MLVSKKLRKLSGAEAVPPCNCLCGTQCDIVLIDICDADASIRSVTGIQDVAVAAAQNAMKGQMPVAFVVCDAIDTASLSSRCRESVRMLVGAFAEPEIIIVPEVPKTVTGKAARSLLRAALSAQPSPSTEAVDRSVGNPHAYWSCLHAVLAWREDEAVTDVPLLKIDDWDVFNFDCHEISGSAIVPATGWILLLVRGLRSKALENVRFLRAARIKQQEFAARVQGERSIDVVAVASGAAMDSSGPDVYVQASIPSENPDSPFQPGSCWDLSQWDNKDILEDIDGTTHYRRCRAVGLSYIGPYACVARVAWRGDSTFRAQVHVKCANAAALLDAALQVVCSIDAVGSGSAFIPYAIEKAEFTTPCLCQSETLVVGRLRARTASTIKADFWYYDLVNSNDAIFGVLENERCFAVLVGVSLSRLEQASSGNNQVTLESSSEALDVSIHTVHEKCAKMLFPRSKCEDALEPVPLHTIDTVLKLSSDVIGNSVDPGKSLFENGIHSLRRIELLSKLSIAFNVSFDASTVSSIETFAGFAAAVDGLLDGRVDAKAGSSIMQDRFGHVDVASLQRVVEARLRGIEVPCSADRCVIASPSVVHEAMRAVLYMVRRGFVRYIGIQYCDGLAHFLCRPPRLVHLDIEVIVPGPFVGFQQTDYNRHFTVREIIRDSERGFYNLVHASGLAHLEHYYRVMFFASRVDARFDLELLEGEAYDMHVSIASIAGPLVDIDVAFHKANRKNTLDIASRAFVVKWRLMLVLNANTKQIFDFEHGGVITHDGAETSLDIKRKHVSSAGSLRRRTRERTGLGRDSVVLVLLVVALLCPFFLASTIQNSVIAPVSKSSFAPIEVLIVISSLSLWFRVSVRMETCDGPIDALLPHG